METVGNKLKFSYLKRTDLFGRFFSLYKRNRIDIYRIMKINENDLGDRMILGLPSNTFGVVNPGVGTFASPSVSQNPTSFFPDGTDKAGQINHNDEVGKLTRKDIESIKTKVTPDEILCGIEYELKRMLQPNKEQAKIIVVKNLKSDPKYYSSLNMLVKGDERVNESVDKDAEKKKAFEEIFSGISEKQRKSSERQVDQRVVDAYRETVKSRKEKFGK